VFDETYEKIKIIDEPTNHLYVEEKDELEITS